MGGGVRGLSGYGRAVGLRGCRVTLMLTPTYGICPSIRVAVSRWPHEAWPGMRGLYPTYPPLTKEEENSRMRHAPLHKTKDTRWIPDGGKGGPHDSAASRFSPRRSG